MDTLLTIDNDSNFTGLLKLLGTLSSKKSTLLIKTLGIGFNKRILRPLITDKVMNGSRVLIVSPLLIHKSMLDDLEIKQSNDNVGIVSYEKFFSKTKDFSKFDFIVFYEPTGNRLEKALKASEKIDNHQSLTICYK